MLSSRGLRQTLKRISSPQTWKRGMATAERTEALAAAGTALGHASRTMSFVRVVDGPETAAGDVLKSSLPQDLDEAYAIQAAAAAEVNRAGGKTVGWKAGATNDAAMKLMGVSAPFFGPIFASNVVSSPTRVATGSMNLRGAELELVFEIGSNLRAKPDGEYTEAEVMAATRRVYPSMELIGSRFERGTPVDTLSLVADQAGHGCLVVARNLAQSGKDFASADLPGDAWLEVNGVEVARGDPTAVLGHPARAAAFVVNRVIERLGVFRSGQFVTTGTMVGKVDVSPGDGLVAHFSGFGKMRVNLDTL